MTDVQVHGAHSTPHKPMKRGGVDYSIVLILAILALAAYGVAGVVIFLGIVAGVSG